MISHREVSEQDREHLEKWIASDEAHRDKVTAEFWLQAPENEKQGTKRLVVEDENGKLFHLRIDNVMRVYVQFPPNEEIDPERLKAALQWSFKTIAGNGKRLGYREMIFDSVSKPLIRFFKKFGFTKLDDTFGAQL